MVMTPGGRRYVVSDGQSMQARDIKNTLRQATRSKGVPQLNTLLEALPGL